jgi:hypothetical protein
LSPAASGYKKRCKPEFEAEKGFRLARRPLRCGVERETVHTAPSAFATPH